MKFSHESLLLLSLKMYIALLKCLVHLDLHLTSSKTYSFPHENQAVPVRVKDGISLISSMNDLDTIVKHQITLGIWLTYPFSLIYMVYMIRFRIMRDCFIVAIVPLISKSVIPSGELLILLPWCLDCWDYRYM